MTSLGNVTIVCPVCTREVSFPLTLLPELRADHERGVALGTITLDLDAVTAHMLTHGPHDGGEPLPAAA